MCIYIYIYIIYIMYIYNKIDLYTIFFISLATDLFRTRVHVGPNFFFSERRSEFYKKVFSSVGAGSKNFASFIQ